MRIIYSKTPEGMEIEKIKDISKECSILYDTARLLYSRNIDTPVKAKEFLNPDKTSFHSPFNFKEMPLAVERIKKAKENGESVLIFGDYDADGVCATTILYYCLKQYGITARTMIPEREEGYGLNLETISALSSEEKIDLIITVDCGISDYALIEKIKESGTDVIVTDHHEPPEILPNTIKINPKIEDSGYPFNCLCGAGVAYKLGYALIGDKADEYLDLVAIATIADSMDLVGENRCLTAEGLKLLNGKNIRKPLALLLGDNNGKPVTSQTVTYGLAPKINAGGRLGDARSVLALFLTENEEEMANIAERLKSYNSDRQGIVDEIYRQARQKIIDENLSSDAVIVVADDEWKSGVVGIVASKLVEDFSRPAIVFAGHDGKYKGSARSIEGVNVFDLISECKDLVVAYGGHSQAAGVTVEKESLNAFRRSLITAIESKGDLDTERKYYAEWNIEEEVSVRFAREIETFEPFGAGNRRPVFTVSAKGVNSTPLKVGSPHYNFSTPYIEMLDFKGECRVKSLSYPISKKLLFELNFSTFRGVDSVKGIIKAVVPETTDLKSIRLYVVDNELKKIAEGDGEMRILPAMPKDLNKSQEGAIYFISDVENLKFYPQLKHADVHVFDVGVQGVTNVVISPVCVPEWAKTVVYLDVPLKYLQTQVKSVCKFDYAGFNFVNSLSVDRSVFAEYFGKILANAGREFKNPVDFYNKNVKSPLDTEEQAMQYLFCFEVFSELGFFYVSGGVLRRDARVQRPLNDSRIYKRISDLQG